VQPGCEVTPLSLCRGGASALQIILPVANPTKENCFNDEATDFGLCSVFSQLIETYPRGERNNANNAWLAVAG
jgi:hypothetical protein